MADTMHAGLHEVIKSVREQAEKLEDVLAVLDSLLEALADEAV